jgi:hypothetical protein
MAAWKLAALLATTVGVGGVAGMGPGSNELLPARRPGQVRSEKS